MGDYNIDEQYKDLLETILRHGVEKEDRTGVGTKSIFGYTIRWDMSQGYPLLTTKKMAYKAMISELRWFLKGKTNIRELLFDNCGIWTGDAYKRYKNTFDFDLDNSLSIEDFVKKIKEEYDFAVVWGELGPIYGKQWRDFNGVDQIKNLINDLKINPDSRRLMVNAWNVKDLPLMALPPCHYGFQMYTTELSLEERKQEFCNRLGKSLHFADKLEHEDLDKDEVPRRKISLMWNQRSVDTFLGLPFNIASYALLLKLIAIEVNMVPDQLIGNLGDCHLYLNHIEQAKEQLTREPYMLPEIDLINVDILNGEFGYALLDYRSHPSIKAPLNN